MKRTLFVLVSVLILVFSLVGCSAYSAHYKAVAYAHSNDSDSATASFYKLDGTEVFTMKIEKGKTARIHYQGSIRDGSLTVYYDNVGQKEKLFSLSGGDSLDGYSETLSSGTVYLIVETDGVCSGGEFDFGIYYD